MKVAIINSIFPFRSTGKIVLSLAKRFLANGDEVFIGYGRGKRPKEFKKNCYRISNILTIMFSALFARIFDNEGLNNYFSTKRFLHHLDKFHPDVIWLHNIHGYYLNYKLLFKWIKNNPSVKVKWTLHDCWAFTGHCAYFTYVQCNQWMEKCSNCCQKKSYPRALIFSRSMKNYKTKKDSFCGVKQMELITPSVWLSKLVSKSFLNQYPVSVQYNQIDLNVFTFRKSEFRKQYCIYDKFIILGVASIWEQRKGLSEFIKMSSLLDKTKFKIVLVGKIPKKQIVSTDIIHIPSTSDSVELAKLYSAADVFFNPTFEDNYPTVNLEAEACGCPVITYDTGGTSETIHLKKSVCLKSKNVLDAIEIIKEMEKDNANSSN